MRVINLTTLSDFPRCRYIRRRNIPVVDELPEIGDEVSLQDDRGIVRSFECIGWSCDGTCKLYQIVLYNEESECEYPAYFVKDVEIYYIARPEYRDSIYGSGEVICVDLAEIDRLANEWDMDADELLSQFTEATVSDIDEYGVYERS
jgi:hypothetical protein